MPMFRPRLDGLSLLPLRALTVAERDSTIAAIRQLSRAVPLSGDVSLCRALGRYKLFVDNRDLGLSPHLLLDGYWEIWVAEVLRATLRHGMVAVDVGANVGCHTLLMADLVGPGGRVHAFEPNPAIMRLLRQSVEVNGFTDRVTLHGQPAGSASGQPVRLVVPDGQPKNAHLADIDADLAAGSDAGIDAGGAAEPGAVLHDLRTVSLDDCLGDGRVDLVKIDVEGAEQAVWRGMKRILARGNALHVILEFTTDRYPDAGAFLQELTGQGFRLSRIDHLHGVRPATAAEVLSHPPRQDQMLLLSR